MYVCARYTAQIKTESTMGLINNLIGNATEVSISDLAKEFEHILFPGERIEDAYRLFRDKWIFTTHRLIIEDIQGITGKKREYHTIPYRSITHFLIETNGTLDTDCVMKIWINGSAEPYIQEFSRKTNIKDIQRKLAFHMLSTDK